MRATLLFSSIRPALPERRTTEHAWTKMIGQRRGRKWDRLPILTPDDHSCKSHRARAIGQNVHQSLSILLDILVGQLLSLFVQLHYQNETIERDGGELAGTRDNAISSRKDAAPPRQHSPRGEKAKQSTPLLLPATSDAPSPPFRAPKARALRRYSRARAASSPQGATPWRPSASGAPSPALVARVVNMCAHRVAQSMTGLFTGFKFRNGDRIGTWLQRTSNVSGCVREYCATNGWKRNSAVTHDTVNGTAKMSARNVTAS